MVVTKPRPEKERRNRTSAPAEETPLIERLEAKAISILEEHDKKFVLQDPAIWQTEYSLLGHSLNLSKIHVAKGRLRGLSARRLQSRRLQAIWHDVGKDHPLCHIYRLFIVLSDEQRSVLATHQSHSAMDLIESFADGRVEDLPFLSTLHAPVCFHHVNYVIQNTEERMDATDLRIDDAILGFTEDRHRPGIPLYEAFGRVWDWIQDDFYPAPYTHLRKEAEESFSMSVEVFLKM